MYAVYDSLDSWAPALENSPAPPRILYIWSYWFSRIMLKAFEFLCS